MRIAILAALLVAGSAAPAQANVPPLALNSFERVSWRAGTPLEFDASGSFDPDGRIVLYEWDFDGDGGVEQSGATLVRPTHTYATAGFYPARLRVVDDGGAAAVATIEVSVAEVDTVQILSAPRKLTHRRLLDGFEVRAARNNAGYGRIINVNVMCAGTSVGFGWIEVPPGEGFVPGTITVKASFKRQIRALKKLRKPKRCKYRFSSNGAIATKPVRVRP